MRYPELTGGLPWGEGWAGALATAGGAGIRSLPRTAQR